MLKYVDTLVGFQEIPDEISLCINISNCKNNCFGCHSPYLAQDIGTPLTYVELRKLITNNKGITCVSFMGGDREPWEVQRLAKLVKEEGLKTAWYSGRYELPEDMRCFDYVKLGPYDKNKGPLNSRTTNQQMLKVEYIGNVPFIRDITSKFWK